MKILDKYLNKDVYFFMKVTIFFFSFFLGGYLPIKLLISNYYFILFYFFLLFVFTLYHIDLTATRALYVYIYYIF